MRSRGGLACIAALALAAPGPAAAAPHRSPATRAKLKAFASCTSLVAYGSHYAPKGDGAAPPVFSAPVPVSQGEGAPTPPAAGAPDSSTGGDSTTNVQELGVDEPDIVKSASGRVFAAANGRLNAVDARSDSPRLLDSLELDGYGHELLLSGERLLVLSHGFEPGGPAPGPGPQPLAARPSLAPFFGRALTVLTEVDIADPSRLRVLHTETIGGSYLTARLVGDTARVVISSPPRAIYESSMRRKLSGYMPYGALVNARTHRRSVRRLATCRAVRRPASFSGLGMLTVLTIDMSRGLPAVDADAVMSGGETVYASPSGLYVATQRYVPDPGSPQEQPPQTTTLIHKFDTSDAGRTVYRASGQVSGYLLNQYSLSEQHGVLRAATTDTPQWWGGAPRQESQSYVTTLRERAGELAALGRIGGLGRGERIYAVRFIDDAAFVVTFRQTDPLFAVDLSDPAEPRVRGELKLQGYSAYLHPVGRDLLIGVGRDADAAGRPSGVQVSLFDIADLRNPAMLHRHSLGASSFSEVEYDARAFLWWEPRLLAVLPVQVYGGGSETRSAPFSGAVGLRVARLGGIRELGRAAHPGDGFSPPVQRSLVVGGRLVTISDAGLEVGSLSTLAEQGFVAFPAPTGGGTGTVVTSGPAS